VAISETAKARKRRWYEKNRARILAEHAARTPEQRAADKIRSAAYYAKFPDKYVEYDLRRKYGMSGQQYYDMLAKQKNVCAVKGCGATQGNRKSSLSVDHCHKTGKVRGLLCSRCNLTLGKVRDDVGLLLSLAEYLDETGSK
jgi:hypothetical protein